MAALRTVLLVLAICVLGVLGWRTVPPRVPPGAAEMPAALRPLDEAMRASPAPVLASLKSVPARDPVTPRPISLQPAPLQPAPLQPAPLQPAPLQPAPIQIAASTDRAGEAAEFLGFYARLRADFPRRADAPLGGGGARSPDAAVWDAMRDLEQSEGVLAAQADPAALDRFFDARSAVLAGLAPLDARRCVDFLYGVTDDGMAEFTASHRGLVATLADRTLDVIADGRGRHLDRPAPTASDLDALSAGLATFGLAPAEVGLLIDGTTPDPPLPDRRLCEIGRTYLDVLHGLPPEARGRIYGLAAQLLARS